MLLQSLDDDVPSDILADIELTSIFGDSQTIEKVSFTGIHKEMLKYWSNPIRITLFDHIASCIESCSMKIRKYKQNNQLIEISDLEMHDDENNQKLLKEMIKSTPIPSAFADFPPVSFNVESSQPWSAG